MEKRHAMDFTGLRPSDALEKAHEAFPEIKWEWDAPWVNREEPCGCAVALLCHALGAGAGYWNLVGEMFPSLPEVGGRGEMFRANAISDSTCNARSFPEAIELLRARGW